MKSGGGGLPGGQRERAFPLLFVPLSHIPAADGCGAAEGTEHEAEGTNKPSSLVLLHRPVSPSLVRRLRGDSGMDFSQEGSSHKTTVKHAPELRALLEGDG